MEMQPTGNAEDSVLSPLEIDAIGEVMNISMGAAATAVSQMLDKKVKITTPNVQVQPLDAVPYDEYEPALIVKITYTEGFRGNNVMVFRQSDMQLILNTLMGISGPPSDDFEFDEMAISAASEVMNQMMGASATALAGFLGKQVSISTPTAEVVEGTIFYDALDLSHEDDVVTITFNLLINDMLDSRFISVMGIDLVQEILADFIDPSGEVMPMDGAPKVAPQPEAPAAPAPQPVAQPQPPAQPQPQPQPLAQPPQQTAPAPVQQVVQPPVGTPYQPPQHPVDVRNVDFPEFGKPARAEGAPVMGTNLDLIMNVPLDVSIEIGSTTKKIRDIMDFTAGTVVELDKQAGAPVDVVVNGQLIARGDVVVIDDNFGVRITEIVGTKDLIEALNDEQN